MKKSIIYITVGLAVTAVTAGLLFSFSTAYAQREVELIMDRSPDWDWKTGDWWILAVTQRADWQMVPEPDWVDAGRYRFEVTGESEVEGKAALEVEVTNLDDPNFKDKSLTVYFDPKTYEPLEASFSVDRANIEGEYVLDFLPFGKEGLTRGMSPEKFGTYEFKEFKTIENPKTGEPIEIAVSEGPDFYRYENVGEIFYLRYEKEAGTGLPIRVELVDSSRW